MRDSKALYVLAVSILSASTQRLLAEAIDFVLSENMTRPTASWFAPKMPIGGTW